MGKKKNKKKKQKNSANSTANAAATSKDTETPVGADDQPKMSKTQLKKLKRQQKQKAKMAGKSQTGEVPVALEPEHAVEATINAMSTVTLGDANDDDDRLDNQETEETAEKDAGGGAAQVDAKPPKKMSKKERKKWQKQQRAAAAKARKAKEDAEFAAQLAAAKGEDAVSEEEGEEEPAEKDADAGAEVDAKPPKKENIPTHTDAADCSAPIDPAAASNDADAPTTEDPKDAEPSAKDEAATMQAELDRLSQEYSKIKKKIKRLKKQRSEIRDKKERSRLKKKITELGYKKQEIIDAQGAIATARAPKDKPVSAPAAAAVAVTSLADVDESQLSNKQKRALKKQRKKEALAAAAAKKDFLEPLDEGTGDESLAASLSNFNIVQRAVSGEASLAWENSRDIYVDRFSISTHKKVLFNNAELRVFHGNRYGLLGPNGQGKSTLLRCIAKGVLKIPSSIDLLMVDQEIKADDTPAVEKVLQADTKRTAALALENELLDEMEALGDTQADLKKAQELQDRLEEVNIELQSMNAERAEAQARKILAGLGFDSAMQNRATRKFSGGWRMRISLARALFIKPTLLMLDEPTNHLDLNAVIWLDEYLSKWENTLLVVSHDQDFLNNICTHIIHLEDQKLYYYNGGFNKFKKMHVQKRIKQEKAYTKQQKELKRAKKSGKSKKVALKDQKKKQQQRKGKGGKGKKGKSRMAMDEDEAEASVADGELIARPNDYVVKFNFVDPGELRPPVIGVEDMGFHYPKCENLFDHLSFGITQSSRVCVVGPNGAGKSTLLNLIMGNLQPTTGAIRTNRRLRMGRYNQHFMEQLPMDKAPDRYIQDLFPNVKYQEVRNMLGNVGLEGHCHCINIKNLSGGQKARVVFAQLILTKPHIIFFDEPTNHLDIESVDALAEAILSFNGGVVLVSHDARLIEEVGFELWICDNNTVRVHPGEFDDYRDELLEEIEQKEVEAQRAAAASAKRRAERASRAKSGRRRQNNKSETEKDESPKETAKPAFAGIDIGAMFAKRRAEKQAAKESAVAATTSSE